MQSAWRHLQGDILIRVAWELMVHVGLVMKHDAGRSAPLVVLPPWPATHCNFQAPNPNSRATSYWPVDAHTRKVPLNLAGPLAEVLGEMFSSKCGYDARRACCPYFRDLLGSCSCQRCSSELVAWQNNVEHTGKRVGAALPMAEPEKHEEQHNQPYLPAANETFLHLLVTCLLGQLKLMYSTVQGPRMGKNEAAFCVSTRVCFVHVFPFVPGDCRRTRMKSADSVGP